ncbi:MAG: Cof-type HAD-IIB family hydrolase [Treponema sp.]|nr:Cof-type HAD-IIB family hydrolase [Treponema sp.]
MSKKIDIKSIKALAIDLDGTTLLPNTTLGDRTRDCLRTLISRGIQIIISTGRAIESSEKFRSAMGAEGPMVFFNGAEVADMPAGKILHANMIGLDVVDFCTDLARDLGILFQVYLPAGISPYTGREDPQQKWGALVIEKNCSEAEMYSKHTGITPVVIKDLKSIAVMPELKGCIKGMFVVDPCVQDEIRARIKNRFGEQITIIRSFPTFLEVINTGVSKGEGLLIAMQHRGLKPQEVIAFGDEENDLPMFPVAGFCGAPANAREKIRNAADFVYGSNADEGLALWLEGQFF